MSQATARSLDLQLPGAAELKDQLDRLADMFRLAELDAIPRGRIPFVRAGRVTTAFHDLVHVFDDVVRGCDPGEAAILGARVRAALLPFLMKSENAERSITKPRGYAGDFLSIEQVYDNQPRGLGPLGVLIDRCFLNLPAARAVRNRRPVMIQEIRATVDACAGRPARIVSFAAGPARELFDTYHLLGDSRTLTATLVDFDALALEYCAAQRGRFGLGSVIELVNANLIHVATGRQDLALADQDLIYSVGLIDYFGDDLVVKLLDLIHRTLRPGGRVILGNFHPCNPTKAVLDHVFDWQLIHRSEADMHRLVRASAFGTSCSRILYEPQRINLFAEAVKA